MRYGELYSLNYCIEVKERDRAYYEVYTLPRNGGRAGGDRGLAFVCLRPDGAIKIPGTMSIMCRQTKKEVPGLEDFHFHMLRHLFVTTALENGMDIKTLSTIIGHVSAKTTLNVYTNATDAMQQTATAKNTPAASMPTPNPNVRRNWSS